MIILHKRNATDTEMNFPFEALAGAVLEGSANEKCVLHVPGHIHVFLINETVKEVQGMMMQYVKFMNEERERQRGEGLVVARTPEGLIKP